MNKLAISLLLLANAISGVAQGMSMIAIPWYFAQNDALASFVFIYFLTNIVSFFWVPLSGSIIDKYDRKKVFLALTVIVGSIIGFISFLGFQMGELPLWIVGFVFVITFLNFNIHYPCLYAFVQEITVKEKYAKMTSILEVIGQFTTIIAGAGATLLLEGTENGILNIFGMPFNIGIDVASWEIHEIFFIDGLTYFAAFIIIMAIRYVPVSVRKKEIGSLWKRLKTGFDFLKKEKPVLWFGVLSFTVFVALLMEAFYLGVSYVNNHLQESGDVYANSKIMYSVGALLAGISMRYIFKKMNIPKAVIILTIITGLIFMTLSQTNSIYILFAMMLLLGITNAGVRIARITYLFKVVPNQLFGRVGSVLFLYNIVLRIVLLGIFKMAFFQHLNNIVYAYMITGAILFLAALLLIIHYKTFDLSLDTN